MPIAPHAYPDASALTLCVRLAVSSFFIPRGNTRTKALHRHWRIWPGLLGWSSSFRWARMWHPQSYCACRSSSKRRLPNSWHMLDWRRLWTSASRFSSCGGIFAASFFHLRRECCWRRFPDSFQHLIMCLLQLLSRRCLHLPVFRRSRLSVGQHASSPWSSIDLPVVAHSVFVHSTAMTPLCFRADSNRVHLA